jgi:hypothetical protein
MRVIFQEVNVEHVQKGKTRYSKAVVTYTSGGRNMQQTMMSFTNPDVFALVQKLAPGQEIEVEITKNDAGYNQWASVKPVAAEDSAPAAGGKVAATGGKAPVSQYETREERQLRQLHIVRQSSVSSAIAALTPGAKAALKSEDVIAYAQELVDFVYSDNTEEDLVTTNPEIKDIPY